MSKFRLLFVATLLMGFCALAQDSSPSTSPAPGPQHNRMHGDRAEQRLKRLSKKLNLTDDQKEKIKPILQDEEKQLTDLESDTTPSQQQKRKKMHDIHMASKSQIEGMLTPEQKEKMPSAKTHEGRHRMSPDKSSTGAAPPSTSEQQ